LKDSLDRETRFLEHALGHARDSYIRRDKDGRPIVTRTAAAPIPASAMDLEKRLLDRVPERSILAAIANTEHWTQWSRRRP
jgi:hypothetical protein